jgi:hypothetical protein
MNAIPLSPMVMEELDWITLMSNEYNYSVGWAIYDSSIHTLWICENSLIKEILLENLENPSDREKIQNLLKSYCESGQTSAELVL